MPIDRAPSTRLRKKVDPVDPIVQKVDSPGLEPNQRKHFASMVAYYDAALANAEQRLANTPPEIEEFWLQYYTLSAKKILLKELVQKGAIDNDSLGRSMNAVADVVVKQMYPTNFESQAGVHRTHKPWIARAIQNAIASAQYIIATGDTTFPDLDVGKLQQIRDTGKDLNVSSSSRDFAEAQDKLTNSTSWTRAGFRAYIEGQATPDNRHKAAEYMAAYGRVFELLGVKHGGTATRLEAYPSDLPRPKKNSSVAPDERIRSFYPNLTPQDQAFVRLDAKGRTYVLHLANTRSVDAYSSGKFRGGDTDLAVFEIDSQIRDDHWFGVSA